ncbi:MAG: 50S ribosomal protein L22 [Candidatus Bathyarchaeota archaeon]|nr:50S ribosomal protein L22 [Candidatus Bathyarchaeota archaeon]
MPSWKYSVQGLDPDKTAIASGRDLRIKPKTAREICNHIKGMKLEQAKTFLNDVIDKKQAVPYYRYRGKVGHRKQLEGHDAGRFPEKAAGEILKILDSVEANAEFKGLYADRLKIVHMAAHRGRVIRKFIPRAFGRASPYYKHLTHIEVAVEEF